MEKISLDKYQKKVIKNKSKNLLVIAGAGSGKTLTIIYKIKSLIQKGISPSQILCITYTKAAALSLEEKLRRENIDIKVKTFHSLGYQIIKQSQNNNLIHSCYLDNLIMEYLNNYKNLSKLIQVPFIELGKGSFKILKNNILKQTIYIKYLKENIKTFISLFKSNNYKLPSFDNFIKINNKINTSQTKIRHKQFLKLVKKIYIKYEKHLNETKQIDFHDMINKAIDIVTTEGFKPLKYIIVDEYQDTSLNKCLLIKAIQNQTNAKLLAVGDDWQSIYRFTGSNLQIFTDFKKYFPFAKILKLKKTYRNSSELLKVTRQFIMKNPYQIDKKMRSNKKSPLPISIYYYKESLNQIWPAIVQELNTPTFILGRNNNDVNIIPYIPSNMQYMTIHKSKGLEANNVILINLENSLMGFPSKIKDSDYLKYVIPKEDNYTFAEERRLFYVALTRTKNRLILLVNEDNPSHFVTELIKDSSKFIEIKTI